MATTATLPLTVWRNDDVCELPLRVRGLDLATVNLAMQVRMHGDASGPALVDLSKVTNGNAEGLRVAGVVTENGIPVSDVRIRINKSTRQALPYMGEAGDPARLEYALLIGGRTRLVGPILLPAHAFGSDAAPAARPASWGAPAAVGMPISGATLTIATDQVVELLIDGAGETGALIEAATDAADVAKAWAQGDVVPDGRSARSWSREAELQAGTSSVAAGIAMGFLGGILHGSVAAGLAATAEGGFFTVRGENAAILSRLYKKVGGQAVEETYLAGGIGLSLVGQRADVGRTFDVTDYGAKGDGRTSDDRAIKTAIRMCALSGGGVVYFPNRGAYYLLTDPEFVLGTRSFDGGPFKRGILEWLPGVSFAGDGSEIRMSGGRDYPGSILYHKWWDGTVLENVFVTGLVFNGNIENQVPAVYPAGTSDDKIWQHGAGIVIGRGTDISIAECGFKGFVGNGISIFSYTPDNGGNPVFDPTLPTKMTARIKIHRCDFSNLFGLAITGGPARNVEISYCRFSGDGYWVAAIGPEVISDKGVLLDWDVHHCEFDFRDGLTPPESTPQFASNSAAAQSGRRHLRRAICAILAYNQYTGGKYNGQLRGLRFTENIIYQGIAQAFNFADVVVARNRIVNFYEDVSALARSGSTAISIGSFGATTGLRNVQVHDNDIESDLAGWAMSFNQIDDLSVRGNRVRYGRKGGASLERCSGTFTGNRWIDCAAPVTDDAFAADNALGSTVIVYGSGSRPLTFLQESIVETRTGAARGMRHGIVMNVSADIINRVDHCSAMGILGDVCKDNGGDTSVSQFGNLKDGDTAYRTNRDFVGKTISGAAVTSSGALTGRSLDIRAPKDTRAQQSFFIDGKLVAQLNVEGGDAVFQLFNPATGEVVTNVWAATASGEVSMAPSWQKPLILGGQLRVWAVNSRLYCKQGSKPTSETDGNLFVQRVAVPASATAAGIVGQTAWDADYFYTCFDTNRWRRVALATW